MKPKNTLTWKAKPLPMEGRDSVRGNSLEVYKKWKTKVRRREYARGISDAQVRRLRISQTNCCIICQERFDFIGKKQECVDHDPKTGKVRGLICIACNSMLGGYRDNPEILKSKGHDRAAWYVERSAALTEKIICL